MTIIYSANKRFAINSEDENSIYIEYKYINEIKCSNRFIFDYLNEIRISSRTNKMEGYSKYTNTINFKKFDNDCLILAEGIIGKELKDPNHKKSLLRIIEDKEHLFGYTDKQNIQIANDINKKSTIDDYVRLNPEIMQAYGIMPVILPKDEKTCPYHVESVIFKDGNTNITLEADSGCSKLDKPIFDIYSTIIPEKSFYERYKKTYTVNKKSPACGILKLRKTVSKKKFPNKRK